MGMCKTESFNPTWKGREENFYHTLKSFSCSEYVIDKKDRGAFESCFEEDGG